MSSVSPPTVHDGDEASSSTTDNSLGRLLTLCDGVFAIAMTLLAFDLRVPPHAGHISEHLLRHELAQRVPSYLSFLISFYVVAGYWMRHRRLMRSVERVDSALITRTMTLLLCVAAVPFAAELLGQFGSHAITLAIYGALNALAAISLLRLHHLVGSHGLASPAEREVFPDDVPQLIATLVIFLLCIPAGYVVAGNGAWTLVLLYPAQRGPGIWRRIRTRRHPAARP
jgi:uncharacterized membrane protein